MRTRREKESQRSKKKSDLRYDVGGNINMTLNPSVPLWTFTSKIWFRRHEHRLVSYFHARRIVRVDLQTMRLEKLWWGYNLLICCIRKLYFMIAYLIIPYGHGNTVKVFHLKRHTDYLPLKVLIAFETEKNSFFCLLFSVRSFKRPLSLVQNKITIILHECSIKPQTNVKS